MPLESTTAHIEVTCAHCGRPFLAWRCKMKLGQGRFCSRECATAHRQRPILERFWGNVDIRGADECWPWLAGTNQKGYGRFKLGTLGEPELAPRFAYAITHSGIPDGAHVLHTCDNPSCVNPAHLHVGTNLDNIHERMARGRSFHTVYVGPRGSACRWAKLTEADVATIRARCSTGETQAVVASDYGVSRSAVEGICLRKHWKHL